MSVNQSKLDDYGYDFVVAVTQDSLNSAILEFLENEQPVVTKCWTLDDDNNTVEITLEELKKQTGVDPFALGPDENQHKDSIKKLADGWAIPETNKLRWFSMGFKAQMGKPPGVNEDALPDIVSFGNDPSKVNYRLLCKQFTVITLDVGRRNYKWKSLSQPPGTPWVFDCRVNLALETTDAGKVTPDVEKRMTPDVQKRITSLPLDSFSIQQLLFKLGDDTEVVTPEIKDEHGNKLDPGSPLLVMLQRVFINLYVNEMEKAGSPIFRVSTYENAQKAKEAPSPLSSMAYSTSLYQGVQTPGLATLNYLAMMDNTKKLPPVKPFGWNWVESNEAEAESGIFALSRSHIVKWLTETLQPYVQRNCWRARDLFCQYIDGGIAYGCSIFNPDLNNVGNVTWNPPHSEPGVEEYKDPAHHPTQGPTLASWHWKSERIVNAGYWSNSALTLNCYFDLSVSCDDASLIIDESLSIYMYCEHYTLNWGSGNIVDKHLIRRFPLDVAAHGALVLGQGVDQPGGHDNSFDPSQSWTAFWSDMQGTFKHMFEKIHNKTDIEFQQLPLSALQQNIFPNGKTFLFKRPVFSAHQDLIAHISYPDQS